MSAPVVTRGKLSENCRAGNMFKLPRRILLHEQRLRIPWEKEEFRRFVSSTSIFITTVGSVTSKPIASR